MLKKILGIFRKQEEQQPEPEKPVQETKSKLPPELQAAMLTGNYDLIHKNVQSIIDRGEWGKWNKDDGNA